MNNKMYTLPDVRFKDEELFPFELYKKENCEDLVKFFESAISDKKLHIIPKQQNPIFDTDLVLPISNEFMEILEEYEVFSSLMNKGYSFRENPRIVSWNYTGREKRGAAHHYHHDGWDMGGQVSVMFLLNNNEQGTHMRVVENTRNSFFHQLYCKIIRFQSFNKFIPKILRKVIATSTLYLIDILLDMRNYKKLIGKKGTLFVFNADQMHKAHAVKGSTRTIVHVNFTKDKNSKNDVIFTDKFNSSSLGLTAKGLCSI